MVTAKSEKMIINRLIRETGKEISFASVPEQTGIAYLFADLIFINTNKLNISLKNFVNLSGKGERFFDRS